MASTWSSPLLPVCWQLVNDEGGRHEKRRGGRAAIDIESTSPCPAQNTGAPEATSPAHMWRKAAAVLQGVRQPVLRAGMSRCRADASGDSTARLGGQ